MTTVVDVPAQTDTAELRIGDQVLTLPIEQAVAGQPAINIGSLLKDGHVTALDYGYANTASTRSAITYLDGDAGILRYRGYPIEQLAERSTFLETAYLLIYGELPTERQLGGLDVAAHAPHAAPRGVQAVLRRLPDERPPDGHPHLGGGGAVDVLPALDRPARRRRRRDEHHPADREDADDRRVRLQEVDRAAVRLPGQLASTTRATSCG